MAQNLRIAVPKGSLFPDAVDMLTRAGLDTTGLANPGRKLIISNPGVDFIIVRPTDAPVFCAYGGADCGMCGKDTLVEADLKSEHGVHRLVRISPTDQQKRRQTTFGGVEVMPVLPDDVEVNIRQEDLRIDVYRAGGPAGRYRCGSSPSGRPCRSGCGARRLRLRAVPRASCRTSERAERP